MKKMTSGELRSMWLNFFKSKGHAVIPSASVIPENVDERSSSVW